MKRYVVIILSIWLLGGCGYDTVSIQERRDKASSIASKAGFVQETVNAGGFALRLYHGDASSCRGSTAHIYIEGDGMAWISSTKLSSDPTPANPVALKLAVRDPHRCTIYIARPCQYVKSSKCKKVYWSGRRYSSEVIASYQDALSALKKRYAISSYRLFGYSGGGTIAAILASRRSDVKQLCTIAGNLDLAYWTKKHDLSPLKGSIDPAGLGSSLARVPQYHFIGGKDTNVGMSVFESYLHRIGKGSRIGYHIVPGYSHGCCWERSWAGLLRKAGIPR